MAKKKNKKNNKNKRNNSPAVAPKAKFSTPEKKAQKPETKKEATKNVAKKTEKKSVSGKINVRKLAVIISAVVFFAVALVLIIIAFLPKVPETAVSEYNGQNATSSVVSDITVDEETQLERYDEIRRDIKGDKKKFKFYSRPAIEIDEKYKEGTLMFSNLTTNECTMIVTIMDEEEDIIFRSMGIEPGKCMQRISLSKTLSFGKHKVMMYVTAYDSMTYEIVGTQYMKLDLMYGDEYSASDEEEISSSETTTDKNITRPVEATKATSQTTLTTEATTVNKTVKVNKTTTEKVS